MVKFNVAAIVFNGDNDVDDFVLELQRFAEKKWIIAVSVLCISMLLILAMVSYVIWYMKREVVKPLELMTKASMQVQWASLTYSARYRE